MKHNEAHKILYDNIKDTRIANLGMRSIFDSLCSEHNFFIELDGLNQIKELMDDKKLISFKNLFISYLEFCLEYDRFYILDGLCESTMKLTNIDSFCEYIMSFEWENIFLEDVINKKCIENSFSLNTKLRVYHVIEFSFLNCFYKILSKKKNIPFSPFFYAPKC